MQRSPIPLYATAVCFAAVACMTIATGVVLYSAVRAAAPEVTSVGYPGPMYAPAVAVASVHATPPGGAVALQPPPPPSPQELERLRREALAQSLAHERRSGIRGLILWGIVLVVSGAVWLLHWRLLKSERKA